MAAGKYASRDNSVAWEDIDKPADVAAGKTAVAFTATQTPTLSNYQANYASDYGENPILRIKTIDGDGNYHDRNEQATYTMAAGLISSISWDLGSAESGFIIIS